MQTLISGETMARLHATKSGRWKPVSDDRPGTPSNGKRGESGSDRSASSEGGGDAPSMDALLVKRQEGVIKALRAKEALLSDTVSALRLQREEEQEELRAEVASLKESLASVRGEYALKFADAVTTPAEEWEQAKAALTKLQTGESSVEVRVGAVRRRQQALTCTCCD